MDLERSGDLQRLKQEVDQLVGNLEKAIPGETKISIPFALLRQLLTFNQVPKDLRSTVANLSGADLFLRTTQVPFQERPQLPLDSVAPLFVVSGKNLNTGMRGYPIGECPTSTVGPDGLRYHGKSVAEFSEWNPEEVIYWLTTSLEPKGNLFSQFVQSLYSDATCSEGLVQAVEGIDHLLPMMDKLSTALLSLGAHQGAKTLSEDCLVVMKLLPEIVARLINADAGWGGINDPNPSLGYIENFAQMLKVPDVDQQKLTQVLRLVTLLLDDHGGGNLSCFTGKVIASGKTTLYQALAGSVLALSGPAHGGASQDVLNFIQEMSGNPTKEGVEAAIRERLAHKMPIPGFGHAVLRVQDPRATKLLDMYRKLFPDDPYLAVLEFYIEAGERILGAMPKVQNPHINVDCVLGPLLHAAGLKDPSYYPMIFALARCGVGIPTQIRWERKLANQGKGTPIYRGKYIYSRDLLKNWPVVKV